VSVLPKGWASTKFTKVLDVNGGTQPPKSEFIAEPKEGYIRLLQIRDFGSKPVPTYIPDTHKLRKCTQEDILIGRYGASIGRICTGMEGAFNVALAKVVTPKGIDSKFLKYYLKSELFQNPLAMLSRSAQNGFNKTDLSNFDFWLAPLNEQIRIADKLDSILAKVDQAQARLEKIPHILKRFRQSVLAAATSGELTREWREDNGVLLSDWGDKVFSELLLKIRSGSGLKPTDNFEGIPILRSSAVRNLVIDYEDFRYLSETQAIKTQDYLSNDDLLFTRLSGSIEYVGNCARVQGVSDNSIQYPDRLFCARLKDRSHSRYLEIYFSSPKFGKYIVSSIKSSAGHQRITIGVLNNAAIQLPSIQEQNVIVHRVEALLIKADKVEKQYLESKARMDRLTQSILAKAFRGELVPQDPNDESADKLLKNIKAEHPKPKGKKK
jgi:type I restriction enzyme S subunit